MTTNPVDLLETCFHHTFDGDRLAFTCQLCGQRFDYFPDAPEHAVRTDLWAHLRDHHRATTPPHAWEENYPDSQGGTR